MSCGMCRKLASNYGFDASIIISCLIIMYLLNNKINGKKIEFLLLFDARNIRISSINFKD